jgi:YidC/Oxa1 family membrane protein insertase
MIQFFNTFFTQPLFNLLVVLYDFIPGNDLGVAIIALTVLIKLALWPLSRQAIASQKALQELQPKLEEIKKRYKDNKEQQAKEMMALYKNEKVNPLSSCLPLLIQLPFLIAVFHVFQIGFSPDALQNLYSFVPNPGTLNPIMFGFLDLSKANIFLAVVTGAVQFWQAKMLISRRPIKEVTKDKDSGAKDEDMMAIMNKQMLYFMPLITIVIGSSLPAGLVLYWFITTLLTVAQQYVMFNKDKKVTPDEGQVIN